MYYNKLLKIIGKDFNLSTLCFFYYYYNLLICLPQKEK